MNNKYLTLVQTHFDKLFANGLAIYNPLAQNMWMASLDTRTGAYPENDIRPAHIPRRHYRAIDAPKGCSLYWNQPEVVAAHSLSKISGEAKYTVAADAYVEDFLDNCVARNGMFLWGNHYYWDAFQGKTVRFQGEETPQVVDFDKEDGENHEARPIPPAWDMFWKISPRKTEKAIRVFAANSVFDSQSGGFNRHANKTKGCAFLESGGILAESLVWLYHKTGDDTLLRDADRVIEFSFQHRNEETGLVENNPTVQRWDKFTSTTEIGLWGGCLLRAGSYTDEPEWIQKASKAVAAYLDCGYDDDTHRYYGKLRVTDGKSVLGVCKTENDSELSLKHQPGDYADIWRPLFPAHDYPMPFAECCLDLYKLTDDEKFSLGSKRWAEIVIDNIPAGNGKGAYAEHYGRCIHFLWRCGKMFQEETFSSAARSLADEAIKVLYDNNMFRGHPGEHRYDAVDGVGFLLLALIALSTDEEPNMMGMGW